MSSVLKELGDAIDTMTWGSGPEDHCGFVELPYDAAVRLFRLMGGDPVTLDVTPEQVEELRKLWRETCADASPQFIIGAPCLDASFRLAKTLVEGNAYHIKRGIHLLDQGPQDVLDHLKEEVGELEAEPDDLDEMGDILNLCANYSARKGWTPAMLAAAMERKMRLRLTLEKEKTA